jgi:hypothetical protein
MLELELFLEVVIELLLYVEESLIPELAMIFWILFSYYLLVLLVAECLAIMLLTS